MKSLLALLAAVSLGAALTACGSTHSGTDSPAHSSPAATVPTTDTPTAPTDTTPAPAETKVDGDKDNDIGAPYDDTHNDGVFALTHPPSSADARAITALIKRYYVLAAAENGAAACAMLYSTLAEVVPEDYGQSPPGQPYMRGTTCAAVLTLLFKHFHAQLALELPKLRVRRIGLDGRNARALLSFGTLPERQISVDREGHSWRIDALLDSELP
jgi:hypothetical protein